MQLLEIFIPLSTTPHSPFLPAFGNHHILSIHSPMDLLVSCFHWLAIANNAAMNMGIQITLWDPAFNSLRYMPRSRIAGSYANSTFIFLRKHHTVFTAAIPFYIPTSNALEFQCLSIFANTCFFLFAIVVVFKILAILMGVKWWVLLFYPSWQNLFFN